MKDRIERTYKKKPKHSLKTAMIFMLAFTAVVSASSIAVLSIYGKENSEMSRRIDNYSAQIDYLEQENDNSLQKYNRQN
ncbi:MAG: hypothetical protein SOR23_02900 [Candidatus Enterosoma sp.]|nr:hypothetical protein [Bacilli bacterium]MDD7180692.1 hypothetical protein [Bacilli bacterium]MDY3047177.1 hypothetical protein [Candidatus Enterosoma sp.]